MLAAGFADGTQVHMGTPHGFARAHPFACGFAGVLASAGLALAAAGFMAVTGLGELTGFLKGGACADDAPCAPVFEAVTKTLDVTASDGAVVPIDELEEELDDDDDAEMAG